MRTAKNTAAAPALHRAQDTLTDSVVPAVRDALTTVRGKSVDLLDSDVAHEARRRGLAVVKAAKGDAIVPASSRRWRFGLGMILTGTGVGLGLAWAARRFLGQPETYTHTMPAPSGTVTSETAHLNGTATATDDVDLRSGMPT